MTKDTSSPLGEAISIGLDWSTFLVVSLSFFFFGGGREYYTEFRNPISTCLGGYSFSFIKLREFVWYQIFTDNFFNVIPNSFV